MAATPLCVLPWGSSYCIMYKLWQCCSRISPAQATASSTLYAWFQCLYRGLLVSQTERHSQEGFIFAIIECNKIIIVLRHTAANHQGFKRMNGRCKKTVTLYSSYIQYKVLADSDAPIEANYENAFIADSVYSSKNHQNKRQHPKIWQSYTNSQHG